MKEIDFSKEISSKFLGDEGSEESISWESWAAAEKSGKKLNKPFRTPKGPKKFSVYVKNEKGNIVKVNFGDPNMEIKRDDPKRRKNFRARHNCENPGPKWKARYWSCKMWSKKSVTNLTKGEEDCGCEESEASESSEGAKRSGPKSGAQTPAKPSEKKRGSSKNKPGSAGEKGGSIKFSASVIESLKNKVKEHNSKYSKKVTLSQLKKVYRRGAGAFSSSHRPGKSRAQWAMARVNTFLKMVRGGKVKDSYRKADQDIAKSSEILGDDFEKLIAKNKNRKLYAGYWKDTKKAAKDPMSHVYKTKEEAIKVAKKMGLDGYHEHESESGKKVYMPGKSHKEFLDAHKKMQSKGGSKKSKWAPTKNR